MAARDTTRNEQQPRYEYRADCANGKSWLGMYPDTDPAGIPDYGFRLVVNGRLRGCGVRDRGGQVLVTPDSNTIGATSCIVGGTDLKVGTPIRAYVTGDGCPGQSATGGFSISWFDYEQITTFTGGVYYETARQGLVLAEFNGDIYVGEDNRLRKLQIILVDWAMSPLALAGSIQDVTLKHFDTFLRINWMENFDGKLFIALESSTAASSAIYIYDGVEVVLDIGSLEPVTGMFRWRNKLIAGFAGTPNNIRVRDTGAAPGTWATVAPGAGTVRLYHTGVSYRGTAYWVTNANAEVWSYDGTTLQVARTVTGAAATPTLSSICLFNGHLYVGDSNATNNGQITHFDGTTWQDNHKQLGGAATVSIRAMDEYRGNLLIGAVRTGLGVRFFTSPLTTTGSAATYTEVSPIGVSGDVDQLLVA